MNVPGLSDFLLDYPGMSLYPSRTDDTRIRGLFRFRASGADYDIEDSFELDLQVPRLFPNAIPEVRETGHKIPDKDDFHVNHDGTLCLGSHLRIKKAIADTPTLVSFAETCIVPYLFNVSIKLRDGGSFVTGELDHGTLGIVQDYLDIFRLRSPSQVVHSLDLLSMKKRLANKRACPCGCGSRLGRCPVHDRLNNYRRAAHRSWFSRHARDIEANKFG